VDLSPALTEALLLYTSLINTAATFLSTPASLPDMVAPHFARHCVAVATWGCNLRSAWALTRFNIGLLNVVNNESPYPHLASWMPAGDVMGACLFWPPVLHLYDSLEPSPPLYSL
jgi:hypothetical protein